MTTVFPVPPTVAKDPGITMPGMLGLLLMVGGAGWIAWALLQGRGDEVALNVQELPNRTLHASLGAATMGLGVLLKILDVLTRLLYAVVGWPQKS